MEQVERGGRNVQESAATETGSVQREEQFTKIVRFERVNNIILLILSTQDTRVYILETFSSVSPSPRARAQMSLDIAVAPSRHQFRHARIPVCFETSNLFTIDVIVRQETLVAKVAGVVRYPVVIGQDPTYIEHTAHDAVSTGRGSHSLYPRINGQRRRIGLRYQSGETKDVVGRAKHRRAQHGRKGENSPRIGQYDDMFATALMLIDPWKAKFRAKRTYPRIHGRDFKRTDVTLLRPLDNDSAVIKIVR